MSLTTHTPRNYHPEKRRPFWISNMNVFYTISFNKIWMHDKITKKNCSTELIGLTPIFFTDNRLNLLQNNLHQIIISSSYHSIIQNSFKVEQNYCLISCLQLCFVTNKCYPNPILCNRRMVYQDCSIIGVSICKFEITVSTT